MDTEGHTHECSHESVSLVGRYQVPDVVFPKHGPTFYPRLWSSTMLLRGGTRGSTVRGNVLINSTVPRRWDTAKRFRPASPAVALENHQYNQPIGESIQSTHCMHEANPCAQLYRFKMAPDSPGIHGFHTRILARVVDNIFITFSHRSPRMFYHYDQMVSRTSWRICCSW